MKLALAAVAALAFATSAYAGTSDNSLADNSLADNPLAAGKATIDLKGLDLATVDGQQRLAIRMDQAARAVCGDNLASIHLALAAQARECRIAVAADVRSRIEARTAMAKGAAVHLAAR